MAAFYETVRAPGFSNPLLDGLVGPTIYKPGYTVTYSLAGKAGSQGSFNDGGTLWSANGARDAFRAAVSAWNAVSNLVIKPEPFYYAEGGSRPSFATWVEKIGFLGDDSPELGEHDSPSALAQEGLFNSQHPVWSRENNAIGGYSFITFLHEIGHGLGLEHPHDGDFFPGVTGPESIGQYGLNQGLFTVMSYNDGYERIGMSPSLGYGWMATPGALDIAAVQAVYGANQTTRIGDDVYQLSGTNGAGTYFSCIWDAAGIDTISGDGLTIACTIDLRPATLKVEEGGGGFLSRASGIFGGFTIASGALIENATGGSAADILIGNNAPNVLNGGADADTMTGGMGDDSYILDDAGDVVNESVNAGMDTVIVSVSYKLGLNVENLVLTGVASISATGNQDANSLIGNSASNVLTGGSGDDFLDGGSGIDTATFSDLFVQANLTLSSRNIAVNSSEGFDTTSNIERFQFADGSFILESNATYAQVQRAYDTILGRGADAGGLDFYVDQMEDRGMSLIAVANDLAGSAEFQAATGGLNNGQFVNYVYTHALGRAADAGGKAYYTQALDQGMSRGAFVVDLSESAEHRGLTADLVAQGFFNTDDNYQAVALLFDTFMGRLPDAGGLTFYGDKVKTGAMTLQQVAGDFAGSAEFKAATQGKSNAQLVDAVFLNTLDRAPDPGGAAYYTDRLNNGMSLADFATEVGFSAEHYNLMSSYIVGGIDVL